MSAPDPSGTNDDLSPSDFVKKIRELGEKRDTEDAERLSTLERDILKGREERAARRAERARSISPEKNSTPPPPELSRSNTPTTQERSKMAESTGESPRPLSRSGTLSWQQRRPKSSSGQRPLSMFAAENAARSPRATPEPANEDAPELSRRQISESLASKDPGWFRQTAERGIGSAAYRRSQEDSGDATAGAGSGKLRMPGMSRESTVDTVGTSSPPPESSRSISPSRASSVRMSAASSRYSNTTANSESGSMRMQSPPASIMDAPKLTPSGVDLKSPHSARPPSPTKGMGGFVESAMLKRADSVSKRWSTQAPPGLGRQSSTASNRSSYIGGFSGVSGSASPTRLERSPSTLNPAGSLEPGSRPSPSHSNSTVTRARDDQSMSTDKDGFVMPALPLHSRTKSVASLQNISQTTGDQSQPSSPSRRWSPTKSSWLESALNKPEEKLKTQPAPPTQPSWMAEINKAKQHKSNASISNPPKLASPEPFERVSSPINRSAQPSPSILKTKSPPPIEAKPIPITKAKSPSPEVFAKPSSLAKEVAEAPEKPETASPIASPPIKRSWEVKKPSPSPAPTPVSTPGKVDFRANLKSRQATNDGNSKTEPEFKNALGNLKRAETKNFVAPDPLKDNILRGKAGLNITGGPAPRVRVDELKESLLKQKEAIKEKAATEPKRPPEKRGSDQPPPEALRKVLHRSESSKDSITSLKSQSESTPKAIARMKTLREKTKPSPPIKPMSPSLGGFSSSPEVTPSSVSERLPSGFRKQPPTEEVVSNPSPSLAKETEQSSEETQPKPVGLPGMAKAGVSGKLASRFNPALANILARGPPTPNGSGAGGGLASASQDSSPTPGGPLEHKTKGRARGPKRRAPTSQPGEDSSSVKPKSPVLEATHPAAKSEESSTSFMSKAKVSAPQKPSSGSISATVKSFSNAALVKPEDILPSSHRPSISAAHDVSNEPATSSSILTRSKPLAPIKSPLLSDNALAPFEKAESNPEQTKSKSQIDVSHTFSPEYEPSSQPKAPVSARSLPMARPLPSPAARKTHEEGTAIRNIPSFSKSASHAAEVTLSRPSVLNESPTEAELSPPIVSVKNATAMWGRQAEVAMPSSPGRPKSPVKLPTRHDEEVAMREAGLMPPPVKPQGVGLGISAPTSGQTSSLSKTNDRSPGKLPLSPPSSPARVATPLGKGSLTMAGKTTESVIQVPRLDGARSRPASASLNAPPESPIPQTSEATHLFADFFDERPVVEPGSDDMDTGNILESYPLTTEKVQTLSKQLQIISGDGKLLPVPTHQEHILFDDSMYVCTHVFMSEKGVKATEVYLWAGSGVPQAAVEDAQLFGRRVAKDKNGKLIVLHQGKETPKFFQALGGILTTFRGSRSRSSSGIPTTFMLCGRKHMGHISFDEVDFSINSLCSGFPYLISSESRLSLWKGKGCSAEELGCARLIAMDLGPTPDMTEISEGEETDAFFNLFQPTTGVADKRMPRSASHWRLKATNDKYRCRLFRVEQQHSRSSTLQVSSFFSSLTRRPSWSSLSSSSAPRPSPTLHEQPKTPTTPKAAVSPLGLTTSTKIVEIAPFTQGDVEAEGIYVLDAFFEIYILIGPLAQSQSHAFATALLFAQDYGILAASLEDRPFVPVSTVVLEGIPRDMKPCFRQWSDEAFGFARTEALMAGKPKRGGSLRCVGLAAALAATRSK